MWVIIAHLYLGQERYELKSTLASLGLIVGSAGRDAMRVSSLIKILILGKKFNVPIEGWHTESGPGVYEAALEFGEVTMMADRACLFKYVATGLQLLSQSQTTKL